MSEELVEAVARQLCKAHLYGTDWRNWTDEARAAIALIRPATLEEAAKECQPKSNEAWSYHWREAGVHIAAAIRALTPKTDSERPEK